MARSRFWLRTLIVSQILTACLHSIGFFVDLPAANESEAQLDLLMKTYKIDAGAGFHPTMMNLFDSLSVCFPLLCLLGAAVTWYLMRKNAAPELLRGIALIQTIIFGVLTVDMVFLAFLLPVVCAVAITIFAVASWATLKPAA